MTVEQGISPDKPFTRLTTGTLAVWCPNGTPIIQEAPVAPQEGKIRAPGDRRPGPLQPNRHRITMALDSRGLDGPEVDEALDVHGHNVLGEPIDVGVVDAWEAGTTIPSELEVRRLATLTGYPLAFFYCDDPPTTGHVFVCYRSGGPH